jgi:hypothetical protein
MTGFRVDMSPLINSSIAQARSSQGIGQALGGGIQAIGNAFQESRQQDAQAALNDLTSRAMGGGPEGVKAFEQLMVQHPEMAQKVAGHLQQKQQHEQGQTDRARKETEIMASGIMERIHLEQDPAKKVAIFDKARDDDNDIDEKDRPMFMSPEGQKAFVGSVKGEDYANSFFGGAKKFEQGEGDMEGHSFDPETGSYNISPAMKARFDAAKLNPELDVKDRQSINKDFTALTSNTKLIRDTAKDLENLSKMTGKDGNVSGPASIAMVFKYMKALDPNSVVRESEFATAENSSGVPDNVRNMYNKLMEGGKLGPNQVRQFVDTAQGLANSAISSSSTEINSFLETFEGTLPPSFKKLLLKRIPTPFDVKAKAGVEPVQTEQPAAAQQPTVNWSDL